MPVLFPRVFTSSARHVLRVRSDELAKIRVSEHDAQASASVGELLDAQPLQQRSRLGRLRASDHDLLLSFSCPTPLRGSGLGQSWSPMST
eukprot:2219195-Rhodomonas_salina.2